VTWDPATTAILILVATCTGGGLWFVVRMIIRFQEDFTNRYALRVAELEGRVAEQDKQIEQLRMLLMLAQLERGALRLTVKQAGIAWDPTDWGFQDDGH
jgi:hypothetical protein